MSADAVYYSTASLFALIALALLVWALFADRSRGRKRCPKCWYDMSAPVSLRCPECGHEAKSEKKLFKTRRRWKAARATLLVSGLAGYLAIQPKVQRDGWLSLVPTTVLLLQFHLSTGDTATDWLDARISSEHLHPRGTLFRVPERERMYRWQWRWLGRRVVYLLNSDELSAQQRDALLKWSSSLRDFVEHEQLRSRLLAAVVQFFEHNDPNVRSTAAIFSLDERNPEGTITRLLPLLSDEDPRVRSGAGTALRLLVHYTKSEEAIAHLVEALDDPDDDVRMLAASALRSAVMYAHLRSPIAKAALHSSFERTEGESTRFRAILVRSMTVYEDEPDIALFLRKKLAHSDPHVRAGALEALLERSEPEWCGFLDAIVAELLDPDATPDGRWCAVWMLRHCKATDQLRRYEHPLRLLLEHDDDETHFAAHAALLKIGIQLPRRMTEEESLYHDYP